MAFGHERLLILLLKPISRDGASLRFLIAWFFAVLGNSGELNRRLAPTRLFFVVIRAICGLVP